MTGLDDALLSGLFDAARESAGWFLLYLEDGARLRGRPAGLRRSRDGRCRLLVRCPDGRLRSVPASRPEGYDPSPEALLSRWAECPARRGRAGARPFSAWKDSATPLLPFSRCPDDRKGDDPMTSTPEPAKTTEERKQPLPARGQTPVPAPLPVFPLTR